MNIVVFGANGPTGLEVCRQALAAGHHITAAVRRPDEFLLQDKALNIVKANVMDGSSLAYVIGNADAVLSTLGAPYSRHEIRLYSVATKAIVEAMRVSDHCRRLVVVSAGLAAFNANTPKERGFFQDYIALPILRNVIGRTLYEDMLRMEDYLVTCTDIEWTIIHPGRLINGSSVSNYHLAEDFPTGNVTTRPDPRLRCLQNLVQMNIYTRKWLRPRANFVGGFHNPNRLTKRAPDGAIASRFVAQCAKFGAIIFQEFCQSAPPVTQTVGQQCFAMPIRKIGRKVFYEDSIKFPLPDFYNIVKFNDGITRM